MSKKQDENVSHYPNSIDTRVALLEMSISHGNDTLNRIDRRLDNIDAELKDLRKDMKVDFRWTIALIIGLAGVMAHGFHWI